MYHLCDADNRKRIIKSTGNFLNSSILIVLVAYLRMLKMKDENIP